MCSKLWLTIVLALAASVATGCQGGLPLMAQANPQTSVSVDPFTKRVDFFSNDGKTFEADDLSFTWTKDGGGFSAKGMKVQDKSVENRQANVAQIEAGAKQIEALGGIMVGCAAEIRRILNPASGVVDSLGDAAPKLATIADKLERSAANPKTTTQPASESTPHE